jgi:hypothetical protein
MGLAPRRGQRAEGRGQRTEDKNRKNFLTEHAEITETSSLSKRTKCTVQRSRAGDGKVKSIASRDERFSILTCSTLSVNSGRLKRAAFPAN